MSGGDLGKTNFGMWRFAPRLRQAHGFCFEARYREPTGKLPQILPRHQPATRSVREIQMFDLGVLTWPTLLKSCPNPVPTAIADSEREMTIHAMGFWKTKLPDLRGMLARRATEKRVSINRQSLRGDSLCIVCNTMPFPNPNGICSKASESCRIIRGAAFRTILNQSLTELEFSFIVAIRIAAMEGKIPNVRLINL